MQAVLNSPHPLPGIYSPHTANAMTSADHEPVPDRVSVGAAVDDGCLTEIVLGSNKWTLMLPRVHRIRDLAAGKKILVFGLEGANAVAADKRLAEYVCCSGRLRANGVDELWCVAINNPYVIGLWGIGVDTGSKMRLMSDRHGAWTSALGLVSATPTLGIQVNARPYSMLIDDGIVRLLSAGDREHRADDVREALLAKPCSAFALQRKPSAYDA